VRPRTHSPAMPETSCPIAAPPTGLSGSSLGTAVSGSCFRYCSIVDGSQLASYWALIVADGDTAGYLTILPRHHSVTGVEIDLGACNDRFALDNREGDPMTWMRPVTNWRGGRVGEKKPLNSYNKAGEHSLEEFHTASSRRALKRE